MKYIDERRKLKAIEERNKLIEELNLMEQQEKENIAEAQRKSNLREKEKRDYEHNAALYGWNLPIGERFLLLVVWLKEHADRRVQVMDKNGAMTFKVVSFDEIVAAFRVEALLKLWAEETDDVPQTEPKYSE